MAQNGIHNVKPKFVQFQMVENTGVGRHTSLTILGGLSLKYVNLNYMSKLYKKEVRVVSKLLITQQTLLTFKSKVNTCVHQ